LAGVRGVAAANILGSWCPERSVRRFAQEFQLRSVEFAEVAGFLVEDERAIADAANLLDEVADFLEHFAQFAVAAFNQNNFVPGIVALANLANAGRRGADAVGARFAAFDCDACAKYVEFSLAGNAGDFDQVSFFHAGGGAGKAVGKLAVVGHQQQAFAHIVEAANGVKALAHLLKELHHRGAAFGILDGGDESAGLV
jgi:hypothetical protein